MTSIASLVRTVVAREFAVPPDSVTDALGPGDVPAWDSIGHLQLIRAIERELDVAFTIEEVLAVASVADLVACASRYRPGS